MKWLINSYSCQCRAGFTEMNCDVEIDECSSQPCYNGGSCLNKINSFTCQCLPSYTGNKCQLNLNTCEANLCFTGSTCVQKPNDFVCLCPPTKTGVHCMEDFDPCFLSPCFNNGSCRVGASQPSLLPYKCECPPGFTDSRCETNVNECLSGPCRNRGTCNDLVNGFSCSCLPGYIGSVCDVRIDRCQSNPCVEGTCTPTLEGGFACSCAENRTGIRCEIVSNPCRSYPCKNDGKCINGLEGFVCLCRPGFDGIQCLVEINECQSNPCLNGAVCLNLVNEYRCLCSIGYRGTNCDININECSSSPCANGSTCLDGVNSFKCLCNTGSTGEDCYEDVDECRLSQQCSNKGTCVNLVRNGFKCECSPGFNGTTCELLVDLCLSSPCLNGGSCKQGVGFYRCTCSNGFEGNHCQANVNECISNPCHFGGTCIDNIDSFQCKCLDGFFGENCQIIATCSQDLTANEFGDFSWPPTNQSNSARVRCPYGSVSNWRSIAMATRSCVFLNNSALWNSTSYINCSLSWNSLASKKLEKYVMFLNNPRPVLNSSLISELSNIMEYVTDLPSFDVQYSKVMVDLLDMVMESNESEIESANNANLTSERLVRTSLLFIKASLFTSNPLKIPSKNFVAFYTNLGDNSNSIGHFLLQFEKSDEMVHATIYGTSASNHTIALSIFRSRSLFVEQHVNMLSSEPLLIYEKENVVQPFILNVSVVSPIATVSQRYNSIPWNGWMSESVLDNSSLLSRIAINFTDRIRQETEKKKLGCAYFDFKGKSWRVFHPTAYYETAHVVTCVPQLPGSLAVVTYTAIDVIYVKETITHISHIGCGVNIFCLVITQTSIVIFLYYRNDESELLSLCCCLSQMLLNIFFIPTSLWQLLDYSPIGCVAMMSFVHYFLLSCHFWLLLEAAYSKIRSSDDFLSYHECFTFKSVLFAWGVPFVLVIVNMIVDVTSFENPALYCRTSVQSEIMFYLSFLGFSILLSFIPVFIFVVVCHTSRRKNIQINILRLFCGFPLSSIMLGTCWTLGLLASKFGFVFLEILFCICNILTGLTMLITRFLLSEKIRTGVFEFFLSCVRRSKGKSSENSYLNKFRVNFTRHLENFYPSSTDGRFIRGERPTNLYNDAIYQEGKMKRSDIYKSINNHYVDTLTRIRFHDKSKIHDTPFENLEKSKLPPSKHDALTYI